ncbi:MAG: DMT family protein [bacterium]|jgi:uncharacterized protein (DUF486 family)|nr:DMT family protein [Phycisphaerales bacterium]MCE2654252.1 DMT family protein [Planctomycetaceae bacterium]
MPTWLTTIVLLTCSNIFMTFAWYYHLKFKTWSMLVAILASWGIAFFEYVLQVPANRIGHVSHGGPFTAPQLKIIQEGLTLTIFAGFSLLVLGERLRWTDWAAFALIMAGVTVGMLGKGSTPVPP